MTLDELRGHVTDVLGTPLSDDQTLKELRSRVNGADLNQLFIAALSVAREQPSEQAELEHAPDASTQRRWQLEDEVLAGVGERGIGTGRIAWEPGRSRLRPRANKPADWVAG